MFGEKALSIVINLIRDVLIDLMMLDAGLDAVANKKERRWVN